MEAIEDSTPDTRLDTDEAIEAEADEAIEAEADDAMLDEADETADELLEEDTARQERSKTGLPSDPTIPKLGLGVVGVASCKVYHQVLTFPNRGQPTSSQ